MDHAGRFDLGNNWKESSQASVKDVGVKDSILGVLLLVPTVLARILGYWEGMMDSDPSLGQTTFQVRNEGFRLSSQIVGLDRSHMDRLENGFELTYWPRVLCQP